MFFVIIIFFFKKDLFVVGNFLSCWMPPLPPPLLFSSLSAWENCLPKAFSVLRNRRARRRTRKKFSVSPEIRATGLLYVSMKGPQRTVEKRKGGEILSTSNFPDSERILAIPAIFFGGGGIRPKKKSPNYIAITDCMLQTTLQGILKPPRFLWNIGLCGHLEISQIFIFARSSNSFSPFPFFSRQHSSHPSQEEG